MATETKPQGGEMMNRLNITALVLFIFVSGTAVAGEWTIGASLGRAQGDTGTGDINRDLEDSGLDATAESSDDSRNAWRLLLGYDYTSNWGTEVAYVDLGDVDTTFSGTTADIDTFLASSDDIHPNTARGWQLSGVYHRELGFMPQLQATGRVGLFAWSSDYTLKGGDSSQTVEESGTDLTYGLGLDLDLASVSAIPRGYSASFAWDRYEIDDEAIDLFSLGVSYHFNGWN